MVIRNRRCVCKRVEKESSSQLTNILDYFIMVCYHGDIKSYGGIMTIDQLNTKLEKEAEEANDKIKMPVTEAEVITINVMTMVLAWKKGNEQREQYIEQLAEYIGLNGKRMLTDLAGGLNNDETRSHMTDKSAEKFKSKLGISKEWFLGKRGLFITGSATEHIEAVWVLYRRLTFLVKHEGEKRKTSIEQGMLDGFSFAWKEKWGDLKEIRDELFQNKEYRSAKVLPKSTRALRGIERYVLQDIRRSYKNTSENDVPSRDYEKLLYHFRFKEHFIETGETLEVLTKALERFTFETLREIENDNLLKRYERALQEQLTYIRTVTLLKKKSTNSKENKKS